MVKSVYIITNTQCNLRCRYCYYNDREKADSSFLDPKKLRDFIDEKIERISITGGEPLINQHLGEYLDILKNHAGKIVLSTNGTLINDKTINFIKSNNISKIFISLDCVTGDCHDKQRMGTKNSVLAAIDQLLCNNVNVQIASVITAENVDGLPELERFCHEKGIKFWPQPIYTKNPLLDIKSIPPKRWRKLLASSDESTASGRFLLNYYHFFIRKVLPRKNKCPLCSSLVIDVNGDIKRCFYSPAFGNIENLRLSQIAIPENHNDCFGEQCFQYTL